MNAIALALVEDFRRDSDLFGERVRTPAAQRLTGATFEQTRDAEMAWGHVLDNLR